MYGRRQAPDERQNEERVAIPFKVGNVVEIGAVQGRASYVYAKTKDGRMHVIHIPSPSENFVDKFPDKEKVLRVFFLKQTPTGLRYTLSKNPRLNSYVKLLKGVISRANASLTSFDLWRDFDILMLLALTGPEIMSKNALNKNLGKDVRYALFVALTFFPLNSFASNFDKLKSLGAWQMTKQAQQGLLKLPEYRKHLTYRENWEAASSAKGVEDCLSITCQAMAAVLLSHYHLKKFEETIKRKGAFQNFLRLPEKERKKILVFALAVMHNAGMVARKRVIDILKNGVNSYEDFLGKYSAQRPRLAKHGNAAVRLYEALALYMGKGF